MKNVVEFFLDNKILVNSKFIEKLKGEDASNFLSLLNKKTKKKPFFLNEDLFFLIKEGGHEMEIKWEEFNKSFVFFEKGRDNRTYHMFLDILGYNLDEEKKKILSDLSKDDLNEDIGVEDENNGGNNVIVLKSYIENIKKREVQDFVSHFRKRYDFLRNILVNRQELSESISINRILNKNTKENISLIGIVSSKHITKNNHVILTLEDFSGSIKVIISTSKKELNNLAKDILLDEVIGVNGVNSGDVVFVNNFFSPDIPITNEFKKLDREEYAIFTGDMHLGSKMFLKEDFLKFINWLNLESGDEEQKEIAGKVKYLFFVGDLVEGVGIYPGQEEDLLIKDIYKQYEELACLISKIRKDIKIILIGGNHDAMRIAEPQPKLNEEIAKPLYGLQNVIISTNPCVVNIASSLEFGGFNVLLYHGGSFPYMAENIESVRINGRLERADLIMKNILQKRHLAPSHEASLYIPDVNEDWLIIDKIPDFFISGHIHKTTVLNYRNVTTVGCGCWTEQSDDQAKRGIVPDPSRVTIVNLQTREVKILNFKE